MSELQRVMVIDDDEDIRQLAEMSLSQLGGMDVCACESGEVALMKLERFTPDIILLDANMPDMDGPETLSAIRDIPAFAETPVVFVTGETRAEDVERMKSLGAIDVISKPFDPMSLPDQVKQIGAS